MSKEFEEWKESVFSHNCSDEYMQGFEDGAELAWNAATEAAKPKWIPVSELLPEIGKEVLVKSPKLRPIALTYQIFPFERFINQNTGWWYFSEEIEWMELPE